NC
ncbi:cytosol aminopeptidase, partial [Vibrio parahaemolyticus EKP-028]